MFAVAFLFFTATPALSSGVSRSVGPSKLLVGGIGERFGVVSSHIKLFPRSIVESEFAATRNAGISWLRCDFAWYDLEPARGEWDFAGTDIVIQEALDNGISILGILGTSPSWANGGHEWNFPPTDMGAWRNYVRTVVSRYRDKVSAWEIWNEENIHAFWQPEPNPEAYVYLLAAASEEIRSADPDATIVMGGVAGLGYDYLDACLSLGAAEYVDAVAYHPYAETIGEEGQPEEDLLKPKEKLSRMLVNFVHGLVSRHTAKELQVWITELGWATCEESPPGVDQQTQAAYLLRTLINYAGTDVDRVFWYNLRDTHLNDIDHYGLIEVNFNPKPSYDYFSTFQKVFGETTPCASAPVSYSCSRPETLEAHSFLDSGGNLALAIWKSDDGDDLLNLSVHDPSYRDPLAVDPRTGTFQPLPGTVRDDQGNLTLVGIPLGKTPVILFLKKVSVTSIAPTRAYQHTIFLPIEDVSGSGFQAGAAERFEADGRTLETFNVMVTSEEHLSCQTGLWGVEPGDYDVVVINPDGSRARLAGGFKVLPLCGTGSGAAVLMLGGFMGLLATAGSLHRRRTRRKTRR